MTKVFISYRRIDANWAAVALRHHITKTFPGTEIFMDISSIEPGADFAAEINRRVDQCEVLLAVIGPNWLGVSDNYGKRRLDNPNDFVRLEIARALERDIRVIPLLIDDAPMPPAEAMPAPLQSLAGRNAITLDHATNEQDLDRLCDFLGKHSELTHKDVGLDPESSIEPNSERASIDVRNPAEPSRTKLESTRRYMVSCCEDDEPLVTPIVERLRNEGIEVYYWATDLRYGADFMHWMVDKADQCDCCISFWSKNYEANYRFFSLMERNCFIAADPTGENNTLFPIELEPCQYPKLYGLRIVFKLHSLGLDKLVLALKNDHRQIIG